MPLSDNSYRILLIEDDPDLTLMYKTKLEADGFIVSVAEDGKAGLRAIRDIKPDLVLLDILIPKKDGFDVLAEKSKCKILEVKNIPVVVLTNLASPLDIEEGRRLGARDWWVKAYNTPSEVSQKTAKFLADEKLKTKNDKAGA